MEFETLEGITFNKSVESWLKTDTEDIHIHLQFFNN